MQNFSIETRSRCELLDITAEVRRCVEESGVSNGICTVYCPHTTGAITINENADPDVRRDLVMGLGRLAPEDWPWRHSEGNSDAHLKSSLVGASERIIIDEGELVLGTWQGIYFCEFDGPRRRKVYIQVIG
ncbi:MAG: secondary thiamine-phosphate synthase enzyme YjbQ [Candidatus Sumerlaeota bacterium]